MSEKYKLRRGGTWYPLATFYEIEQHDLKIADNTQSGHVIIGDNIQLDNDGTISVKNASVEDVGVVQIVDDLTTDDDTKVLSAKQGYELKQLIDNIDTSGGGGTGSNIVVEDSFTSTSTINALSANKGSELKVLVDTKASQLDLEALEATVDNLTIESGNVTQAEKDSWDAKSDFSGDYNDLLNKPTIPTPIPLNNTLTSESTSEALTAKQGSVLKSELDDITTVTNQHIGDTSNPHNVTKSQVGLSDVDNVKQATKTEFDAHNENNTIHITETERTSWSNKAEKTYVDTKVSELVNSAPETLNTLGEIAEAIQNTDDALDGLITTIGTKASSADLTSHIDNSDIHITPTERTNWNGKADNTLATNTTNGLMSNVEKAKLASISSGANFVQVLDDLTSTSTTSALSAGKGKEISDKIDILSDETNLSLVNISDSLSDLGTHVTDHLAQSVTEAHESLFQGYREAFETLTETSPTINADNFNVFKLLTTGATNFTFSTAKNDCVSVTLFVEQGTTPYSLNFPTSVKWKDGVIPDISKANKIYTLTFVTYNTGVTWLGSLAGVY